MKRTTTEGPVSARILEILNLPTSAKMTLDEIEHLTSLACVAWNMAVYRKRQIKELPEISNLPPEMHTLVEGFVTRKDNLFPDDDRLIFNCDVKPVQGRPDVYIASIPFDGCFLPDGRVREGVPSGNILKWQAVHSQKEPEGGSHTNRRPNNFRSRRKSGLRRSLRS